MTVEIPVPEGPPCDFCDDWPAVGSLMQLANYSTQKFCASCGPAYLLSVVEAMTGAAPDDTAATDDGVSGNDSAGALTADDLAQLDAATPADTAAVAAAIQSGQPVIVADDDPGEPGSPRDHWASTTHVRRSTHGHRGTARPKGDDE